MKKNAKSLKVLKTAKGLQLKLTDNLIKPIVAIVLMMFLSGVTSASGHFVSGLQAKYPEYDLNDSYVFKSSQQGYTSFIASANPSAPGGGEVAASGKDFGENGLYNLHIAFDDTFKTGMTYVFSVSGNKVNIYRVDEPDAVEGQKGEKVGKGEIATIIHLKNGVRAWIGRGKEPFFGNGVDLAKFNAAKQEGRFKPELFKESGDLFVESSASFFVLDIPNEMLGKQVKFFNTTATKIKGEWKQIDRHANVLFPYIFLSDTPAVQEDHGQHRPLSDVIERRQTIVHNVFWAISTSNAEQNDPMRYANKVADLVMPDVLTYRIGTDAHYTMKGLNGRPLDDDAMNTVLHLMMGVAVDDYAYDEKRYKNKFPYIIHRY